MPIRGVSLTVTYTAWDTVANGPKTGDVANHTIKVIKDGTEATATNSPAEVASATSPGEYKIVLTTTEMSCDFITIGGKSTTSGIVIIPVKIATEHGVLPTIAQGNAGAVLTSGTGTAQLNVSGGIGDSNTTKWNGTTVNGTLPPDIIFVRTGTCQSGSTSTTIKLDSGASSQDDLYKNEIIYLLTNTGAKQSALISSYNGTTKVATITSTWAVTPDNTTTYLIIPADAPILSASGVSNIKDQSGTYDLRQMINMIWEICMAGKISGLPNSPSLLRNFADTLDRAHISFDTDNNRTTIVINNAP